jgi:phosphoglycerate dehydrogenase-like enzyme
MKDGATLVNTARGAIVDTDALVEELQSGRISAVLDVTDPEPLPEGHPLRSLPNVFLTPHIAGAQGRELRRLADLAIAEVERFAAGEPPLHPVRETDLDRIA